MLIPVVVIYSETNGGKQIVDLILILFACLIKCHLVEAGIFCLPNIPISQCSSGEGADQLHPRTQAIWLQPERLGEVVFLRSRASTRRR
jgi:hypothetical protein